MKKVEFNRNWKFSRSGTDEWQNIMLPHDAMIYEERSANAPSGSGGGFFSGGKYIYKKTFVPRKECGEHLAVVFEGVWGECIVSINGRRVAINDYGYTDFEADISHLVEWEKENEIKVCVKNDDLPNSRWYTGSGIYRSVWLYTGGAVRIGLGGLRISVPEVAEDVSKIEIAVNICCDREDSVKTKLYTEIFDEQGKAVYRESTPFTFFGKGEETARQRLYLQNCKLWSTDTPHLYHCSVKVTAEDGSVLDTAESDFGIRKITVDPVHGFRLNGKTVLLRGACIHHDNGVIGAAEFYDACERRIKILKDSGFNAVRISHHPCSESMLEACDKLGMLVWDETFDMWREKKTKYDFALYFDEEWKTVVDRMIRKDFNHPCVFAYSIGNEIPEIVRPQGTKISRMLSEHIRALDVTRFVTNAINGLCAASGRIVPLLIDLGIVTKEQVASITGDPNSDSTSVFNVILQAVANGGDINDAMLAIANNMGRVMEHPSIGEKLAEVLSHLDVSGYNYMKSRYDVDARDCPNKIIVGSETTPPDIDLLWEKCRTIPQLIGDFTWTGWDYIGEAGVGHTNYEGKSEFSVAYPGYLAYCGDIDITGYRRPMSYLREIVYGLRTKPYLSVQSPEHFSQPAKCTSWAEPETIESWTWSGYEGQPIRVTVYSSDEEIELLVNDAAVGKKKVDRNRAVFETVYHPGKITAVGYKDGKKTECCSVSTAGPVRKIKAVLSKERLVCGKDLCYVQLRYEDENGVLCMDKAPNVTVSISENVQLMGFGNGDPCSTENFFSSAHSLFQGRALAVVRGIHTGEAEIGVTANGHSEIYKITIIEDGSGR